MVESYQKTKDKEVPSQKKLSLEQLSDVQDVLRGPLSGRSILLPLGSKAFFAAKLEPKVDSASSHSHECVLVRCQDGSEKEMTRKDAIEHIGREAKTLGKLKKSSQVNERTKTQAPSISPTPSSNRTESSTPQFFEIREEYSESGKDIRGELINVTKELERFGKEASGKPDPQVDTWRGSDSDEDEGGEEASTATNGDVLKQLSDEQYASLSARLDELAQLEERANLDKSTNKKSAKKLQSKGWSKGFFNSKPKKKPQLKSSAPASPATASRKVAFEQTDSIREIPRIGEKSINTTRKPSASVGVRPKTANKAQQQLHPGKLLEESIFTGVVREKPARAVPYNQQQLQQQPVAAPKKKLSRFAQERQQYR